MPHHSICFIWVRKSNTVFAPDFLRVTTAFKSNSEAKQNTFTELSETKGLFCTQFSFSSFKSRLLLRTCY